MQHNKKKKRSVLILFGKNKAARVEKGVASSTKMDFMNIKNEFTITVFLG
jgi:hypothetical protein